MWERFSYYGMRAMLVLYLVNALKWDTPHAANLYGTYTMLVYLTPVIGGYLADRFIGTRRSLVIGSIVISLGHFTLAFPGMTRSTRDSVSSSSARASSSRTCRRWSVRST